MFCSAGSSGSALESVSNIAPWILFVAASTLGNTLCTLDREFNSFVEIKMSSLPILNSFQHHSSLMKMACKRPNTVTLKILKPDITAPSQKQLTPQKCPLISTGLHLSQCPEYLCPALTSRNGNDQLSSPPS
ncbi:hypothetical protein HN51_022974 [Arachis hypogaea]